MYIVKWRTRAPPNRLNTRLLRLKKSVRCVVGTFVRICALPAKRYAHCQKAHNGGCMKFGLLNVITVRVVCKTFGLFVINSHIFGVISRIPCKTLRTMPNGSQRLWISIPGQNLCTTSAHERLRAKCYVYCQIAHKRAILSAEVFVK